MIQCRLQAGQSGRVLFGDDIVGSREPKTDGGLSQIAVGQGILEQGRTGIGPSVWNDRFIIVDIRPQTTIYGGCDDADLAFPGPLG